MSTLKPISSDRRKEIHAAVKHIATAHGRPSERLMDHLEAITYAQANYPELHALDLDRKTFAFGQIVAYADGLRDASGLIDGAPYRE